MKIISDIVKSLLPKSYTEVKPLQLFRFVVSMQIGPQLKVKFETKGNAPDYETALKMIERSIKQDMKNATITIYPK